MLMLCWFHSVFYGLISWLEDCRGLAWSEDMPKIMFYLKFDPMIVSSVLKNENERT